MGWELRSSLPPGLSDLVELIASTQFLDNSHAHHNSDSSTLRTPPNGSEPPHQRYRPRGSLQSQRCPRGARRTSNPAGIPAVARTWPTRFMKHRNQPARGSQSSFLFQASRNPVCPWMRKQTVSFLCTERRLLLAGSSGPIRSRTELRWHCILHRLAVGRWSSLFVSHGKYRCMTVLGQPPDHTRCKRTHAP